MCAQVWTNLESEAVNISPGEIMQSTLLPLHLLQKIQSVYTDYTKGCLHQKVKPFKYKCVYAVCWADLIDMDSFQCHTKKD